MNNSSTKAYPKQAGVTLLELVIIIIVVGVVAIPFSNAFLTTSKSLILNADITQSGSLARECAEFILHQRRVDGFDEATLDANIESMCDDPVIPGFGAPQETISVTSEAGNTPPNCPNGSAGCDLIKIEVRDATATTVRNELYFYLIY